MKWRFRLLALLGILLATINLAAQDPSVAAPAKHPKVGLVLEGGGALGLAHIGVIQWLAGNHIPVSYIAGTSMGGLVGGIYATGKSAEEVHAFVQTIDWDGVLRGQTHFQDLSFRRKEDAREYPNRLEFGLRNGVQFPEGLNTGMDVGLIFDRVALPYSEMQSFDDLPIPFACVATDLVSSRKFVFREGSLALALRSTMSLPGVFNPVRWNGHIFVDGGMVNNLPVEVAKDMGADLTIAVYLQTAPLDPEARLSSLGVLRRSVSVAIAANELRSIEQTDILISVPLETYSLMGFNQADSIIKAGYDAAQAKSTVLSSLAVDDATWQEYIARRAALRRTAPVPEFVKVTGTSPKLAKAIEVDLSSHIGQPVDTDTLQLQLQGLRGEGRFNNLGYQITTRDGQPGLQIRTEEKSYAPPTVRPLLLLDGSNFSGVYFSIGARITFQDFGSYRTELRNDVIVGSEYGFNTQYYRPFNPTSNWFMMPDIFASSQQLPFFEQNNLLAQYRKKVAGGGMHVGYEFGRVGQLTVGYQLAYQSFSPEVGNPDVLATVSGRFGASQVRYTLNQLDDPVIPRSGQSVSLRTEWVDANPGALNAFPVAEGRVVKFLYLNRPNSLYFGSTGGTVFGYHDVGVPAFLLGGNNQFAAYGDNELLTNQYYAFQAGYLRQLINLPPLLGDNIYFHALFEAGQVFGQGSRQQTPSDVSGALVINTIFGPIAIGGAVGAAGHSRIFLKIGRIF
jgi:NTE family protein